MWLFFGLPLVALFIMGIIHASSSVDKIRENWNEYRCNPIYMPFAGHIRPDISTSDNFTFCMNMIGQGILKYALDSIGALFSTLTGSLSEITKPIPMLRELFTRIRKFMLSFTASTLSKAAGSTSVFIHYLIKIRDMLKRFVGQGYISAFLTSTMVSFVWSFVSLFITILKTFVYVLLAISFVLALFQPELLAIAIVLASLIAASGF